jgi:hypothetical protein
VLKKIAFTSVLFLLLGSAQAMADIIDGEEFVDPTRPFSIVDADDSSLVQDLIRTVIPASYDVSFIRASSSSPMAVINQQRVTIGDVIGGAEVLEIDRNGVTLLVGEEERRISLYDTNIKATSVSQ